MNRVLLHATLLLAMTAAAAQAASFDCAKAEGATEKMICGDAALSALDEELARAYTNAIANPADLDLVKAWQKIWLAARNLCGDVDCMRRAYAVQIGELRERAGRGAMAQSTAGPYSGRFERHVRGKRDLHAATLTIVELNADRVRVMGSAVHVGNPATGAVNVGEISGLSRLEGNRIAYREPGYAECKFVITIVEKGLQVGEDGMNCGGHNVTFTGEYRKRGMH